MPGVILVVRMERGHKLLREIAQVLTGTRDGTPGPREDGRALSDLVSSEPSCGRAPPKGWLM
jgi:hypothetical protein